MENKKIIVSLGCLIALVLVAILAVLCYKSTVRVKQDYVPLQAELQDKSEASEEISEEVSEATTEAAQESTEASTEKQVSGCIVVPEAQATTEAAATTAQTTEVRAEEDKYEEPDTDFEEGTVPPTEAATEPEAEQPSAPKEDDNKVILPWD